MSLNYFHPAVSAWFEADFKTPTQVQTWTWPAIHKQHHTLIAAPTGSDKTLAAYLAAIDDLIKEGLHETPHCLIVVAGPHQEDIKPRSATELEHTLSTTLTRQESKQITVVVIDCALSSAHG